MKIYTGDQHHEYSSSLVNHELAEKAYFLTPQCQTSGQPIKKKIHLRVTAEPSDSQTDSEDPQLPELYQDPPKSLSTIASFSKGFENFLHYLASSYADHPPLEPDGTHQPKAAVETLLEQSKLTCFDANLTLIISPSSHELLVIFQIHELNFASTNTPKDLKHRLRHLLFLYQKVSARYPAYKPISSGYLGDDSDSVPDHIWGQAQLSWNYLELNRWLDPLIPCYELHDYYATLLRRLCFLVGPGGFHPPHQGPIWIWGDYDGSLGLLISREGHEVVSFHNHSPRHCQARGQSLDIPYQSYLADDPRPQETKKISASGSQNYESSENFWKILREKNQLTKAYHYLNTSGAYFNDRVLTNKPADILQKAPATALITTFNPDSPFAPHTMIHELQGYVCRGAGPILIMALDPSTWQSEENPLSWTALHQLGYTLKQSESYHLLDSENHPDRKTHLLILEPPHH